MGKCSFAELKLKELIERMDDKPNMLIVTLDAISIQKPEGVESTIAIVGDFIINGDVERVKKGITAAVEYDNMEYFYDQLHSFMNKRRSFHITLEECCVKSSWEDGEIFLKSMCNVDTMNNLGLQYYLYFVIDEPSLEYFSEFQI